MYKNKESLFILDDPAYDRAIKSEKPVLEELAFTSKHLGESSWIITQKYSSINKSFCEQLSWLAIFYCNDRDSFKVTLHENNAVPNNKIEDISDYLKSNQHSKLIIRFDNPILYKVEQKFLF